MNMDISGEWKEMGKGRRGKFALSNPYKTSL
jgi:hypothetical protein